MGINKSIIIIHYIHSCGTSPDGAFPSAVNFPVLQGQGKGAVDFTARETPPRFTVSGSPRRTVKSTTGLSRRVEGVKLTARYLLPLALPCLESFIVLSCDPEEIISA
jgi:hypothetical protein